jgi:hypothetical protein
MFWKIKLILIKNEDAKISIIRIYAESLKEALEKTLDLYRHASILSYQREGDAEIPFDPNKSLQYQTQANAI